MYSVGELVRILGLKTETQVRNRIEAIRDVLESHLHRGPNNRILVDERGLEILKALQGLCESGKTLKEAAKIVRSEAGEHGRAPGESELKLYLEHLEEEIRFLRELILRERHSTSPWWERWRSL